ncbi:MAG TPA: SDR family oxidoreductase [Vicinamibacteria bacterium]|nr:SDR family oxidoreductase [Vicinamibacteria bacterium]
MRLLVTGAAGVLGGRLAALLARSHSVVAARHEAAVPAGLAALELDLLSPDAAEAALEAARPDAVVHAAALVEPDRCEREPELAARLNTGASERLAAACARHGAKLILVSTDLVFDDADERHEGAAPHPVSVYGRTKRAAEEAVLAADGRHAVARVPLVIGHGHGPRGTATEAVCWALRERRPLELYADQWRTPSDPESTAAACESILERDARGIFHLGGGARVTRHELGLRVAAVFGQPTALIAATTHDLRPPEAPRPRDACLDSARTRAALDWEPRPLDVAVASSRPAPPGR